MDWLVALGRRFQAFAILAIALAISPAANPGLVVVVVSRTRRRTSF